MREIKERYKGGAPSPSEGKPSERGKESEEVILVNKGEVLVVRPEVVKEDLTGWEKKFRKARAIRAMGEKEP